MNLKEVITEAVKEGVKEAILEYENSKNQKSNKNRDLISTNKAYQLRGRSRVDHLIRLGLLKQITTGTNPTSVKYISQKKLLDLDKVNI